MGKVGAQWVRLGHTLTSSFCSSYFCLCCSLFNLAHSFSRAETLSLNFSESSLHHRESQRLLTLFRVLYTRKIKRKWTENREVKMGQEKSQSRVPHFLHESNFGAFYLHHLLLQLLHFLDSSRGGGHQPLCRSLQQKLNLESLLSWQRNAGGGRQRRGIEDKEMRNEMQSNELVSASRWRVGPLIVSVSRCPRLHCFSRPTCQEECLFQRSALPPASGCSHPVTTGTAEQRNRKIKKNPGRPDSRDWQRQD